MIITADHIDIDFAAAIEARAARRRASGLAAAIRAAWQARAGRARPVGAMRRLDDRLLRDIGLSRADAAALDFGIGAPTR